MAHEARKILAITVALMLAVSANAADLRTSYLEALAHDMQWLIATSKSQDSEEYKSQALARVLPNISYSASKNTITQEITTSGVTGPRQNYPQEIKSVTVRQPLLRAQEFTGLSYANSQYEQAQYMFRDEQQQLVVRLVSNYLDALQAKVILQSIQATVAWSKENVKLIDAKFKSGHASGIDLANARAELDRYNAQLFQATEAVEFTLNQLNLQTGNESPRTLNDLVEFKEGIFKLPKYTDLVEKALLQSPKILSSSIDVEMAKTAFKQAAMGHLPTVDLIGQVSKNTADNQYFVDRQANQRVVGVQLSMPIYSGGAVNSKVRQAIRAQEQAELKLSDTNNRVKLQIQSEHNTIRSNLLSIGAYKAAYDASDKTVKSNKLGASVGIRSGVDVLRSVSDRDQVFLSLQQARFDTIKSWFRLNAILGEIDEEMISNFNSMFN